MWHQDKDGNVKILIVACGGKIDLDDSSDEIDNVMCLLLNGDTHTTNNAGQLKSARNGAASLVLDNGKSLWITGGSGVEDFTIDSTEYMKVASKASSTFASVDDDSERLINEQGPHLPLAGMEQHCLVKVGPEIAMLIGGCFRGISQLEDRPTVGKY